MDGHEDKKPSRFAAWPKDRKGWALFGVAIGVLVLGGGGVVAYIIMTQPAFVSSIVNPPQTKHVPPAPKFYSPLTGAEVPDDGATHHQVTAIMIENSDAARPQSGLKDAGVVYEAIAEGGITRFMALYQEGQPNLIGPVRSIRPYYVEWADPFDAAMAHVGGSSHALDMIRSGDYSHDLDQFFNGNYYWRTDDRAAPHNVYTTFPDISGHKGLDSLETAKGYTSSSFTPFPRKAIPTPQPPGQKPQVKEPAPMTGLTINVHISGPDYDSSYTYDPKNNDYPRSEGGAPHMDREKGQIAPSVVIVMKVPMSIQWEDTYREQISTTGSGEADIFQDGTLIKGTWSRPDVKTQMAFLDSSGKPIDLERGQTWITAIPNDSGSVSWQ